MLTSAFDFFVPPELIAQTPTPERDQSRLLVMHRTSGRLEHRLFRDLLDYFRADDVLVLNNSRVIPARLRGTNLHTGGEFEILLLEEKGMNDWWAMLRPGKRARAGTQIVLRDARGNQSTVRATVVAKNVEGHRRLHFSGAQNITTLLDQLGEVPLPPYISRTDFNQLEQDRERYQTIFAEPPGSIAAPTSGLHFTGGLLAEIRSRGAEVCFLTLHVGFGTFAPVKSESILPHQMHQDAFPISEETARRI